MPALPPARVEHEESDRRLKRERSSDDPQADRLSVRGQRIGNTKNDEDPGDAEQLLIH